MTGDGPRRPPRPRAPQPEPRPPAPQPEPRPPAPQRESPPPPPKPERPAAGAPAGLAATAPPLPEGSAAPAESLLDLVDSLLNKGAVVSGDVVLGLAGIDLVYLKLSALLAAADRVTGTGGRAERIAEGGELHRVGGATAPRRGARRERLSAAGSEAASAITSREEAARISVAPAEHMRAFAASGGMAGDGELAVGESASPSAEPSLPPGDDAPSSPTPARPGVAEAEREIDELRAEIERGLPADRPPRWNADPEEVERSVAKLVLTLVELVRQLLERQALRRMEEGTLTEEEVETLGRALMRLEETVHAIAGRFGVPPAELNLDLGPLGRLL